jgi:hypothetical protein
VKALYLDGSGRLEVCLDGPALRVRRPGRADGQFPLPRLARVIVVGQVHWRPEALHACLRDHKPVVVLDSQGRFVRVLFESRQQPFGLARRTGELLAAARFRQRYQRWFREAERAEMQASLRHLGIPCRDLRPVNLWQKICREQHHRWHARVGACYRYLLGLAAAQIVSALCLIGMPRDPQAWEWGEYRLFCDMLELERWHQAVLLEELFASGGADPDRRALTEAFERRAGERDQRIMSWRQRALLEMMGLGQGRGETIVCQQPGWKQEPLEMSAVVVRICQDALYRGGNHTYIPRGPRISFRTNVRIVRSYLEYDRRTHESHGATKLADRL